MASTAQRAPAAEPHSGAVPGARGPKAALARALSFPVLLGAMLAAGAMVAARYRLPDPDLWYHVSEGRALLATHVFPTVDVYSFTAAGNPSIAFEWLGEAALALAERAGGLAGLMALLMALSASLTLLIYYWAYQRCGNSKAAFVAALIALPLVAAFFTLRPQLIGFNFLLITLICLERFRQGRHRAVWVLPPLFLVWVNTHGSFVLGLCVCALYAGCGLVEFRFGGVRAVRWTSRERLQLEIAGLLSAVALAVTPYGPRLVGFTIHVIFNAPLGMSHITEYQPLGAAPAELDIFLALVLPLLIALLVFRPTYRLEEIALFLGTLFGACAHSRLLFVFMVAFAPLAAGLLARWVPRYEPDKDRPAANLAIIALLGLALYKFFPASADIRKDIAQDFPSGAVEYLRAHPVAAPMLNDYGWGGYLIWTLAPQHKVFVDGRSQLYEEAGVYGDYLRIMAVDPQTQLLLRKYAIGACLIHTNSPLGTYLAAQPGWRAVYSDKLSEVLVRQPAAVSNR